MNEKHIPVIDLSLLTKYFPWQNQYKEKFITDPEIKKLSRQISEAFTNWGFVYIKNHGIDDEYISDAYEESQKFFSKSLLQKNSVVRLSNQDPWGYVPFNEEVLDKTDLLDLRKCFDFAPNIKRLNVMKEILPNFSQVMSSLYVSCHNLSILFMYLLNMAMSFDVEFLQGHHSRIGCVSKNLTMLRMLSYPAVSTEKEVDQLRCEEHTDYGTFTFLFQNGPGLQVMNPSGEYIDATPIPGTIVVNAGDLLEIWSSGKFKSTKHKVLLPSQKFVEARQSMAFFCLPNNDAPINCLDDSKKVNEGNFFEYLMKKYSETYG